MHQETCKKKCSEQCGEFLFVVSIAVRFLSVNILVKVCVESHVQRCGTLSVIRVRAQSYVSTGHYFSVIQSLVRDYEILLSSYASDVQSPYRALPHRFVLEIMESVQNFREFCEIITLSSLSNEGTPQSVHDWIKEVWRIQLLIGLCNCIVRSEAFDSFQPEGPFKQIVDTLCKKAQFPSLMFEFERGLLSRAGFKEAFWWHVCSQYPLIQD